MFHYPTTTDFAPNKTCLRIMKQLHGYFSATKKGWAHISQAWLMEQLQKYEHQTVPSSTLNYNLRILEENGFIIRQKRHYREKATGQIIFRPSMYKITSKLKRFFSRIADWFKRCGWTPNLARMGMGHVPVVGKCVTKDDVTLEHREQWLERQRQKIRGKT